MVKIKQIPEDFVVQEIFEKKIHDKRHEKGFYVWFTLKKRNWDLFSALKKISKKLGVSIKRFGYAGVKDRKAVTYQKISVWNVPVEKLENLKIKDIELSDFEIRDERINIGDLKGNRFIITIRDIDKKDIERIEKNLKRIKTKGFINFFGEQRFGSKRMVTHLVGREILKGNLEKAVWLYLTRTTKDEPRKTRKFRKYLEETKDLKGSLKICPKGLRIEKAMINHLIKNPNDYAGALRKIPKKLRRLFIHAYQAYLWNEIAKRIDTSENIKIPLIGYETELKKYRFHNVIKEIIEKEGVKPEDFKVSRMPELASEGDERDFLVFPVNLKYKFDKDEINKGKNKCVVEFELPKGSYATVLLEEVLK